jgi:nitroimidazol reductase NimA-like FMN-containing flavoprotein (pyridoxamine 5'-phosphate oxidase superfamily)
VKLTASSAWSLDKIERFVDSQRIPIRLAFLTPRREPLVCSLWYLYDDRSFWLATQKSARVARNLECRPLCGFEIAPETPPYKGVRGQAEARLLPERGPDILARLIDRYLGGRDSDFARWLMARSDREVAIRLTPTWLTSWDFAARMQGVATPPR